MLAKVAWSKDEVHTLQPILREHRAQARGNRSFWNVSQRVCVTTHPFAPLTILCRSFLHCSQKYSSGLVASSMMPTQPPCCQTLQESHWMKRLPASSERMSESVEETLWPASSLTPDLTLLRCLPSRKVRGKPGYSCCPQIHRVISSSPSSSSSSSSGALTTSSLSSSRPRLRWRV